MIHNHNIFLSDQCILLLDVFFFIGTKHSRRTARSVTRLYGIRK